MTGYDIFCTVLASLTLLSLPFWWRVLKIDGREQSEGIGSDGALAVGSAEPSASRPSVIHLQHHGEIFECADIWAVIEVARLLAEIEALPEVAA